MPRSSNGPAAASPPDPGREAAPRDLQPVHRGIGRAWPPPAGRSARLDRQAKFGKSAETHPSTAASSVASGRIRPDRRGFPSDAGGTCPTVAAGPQRRDALHPPAPHPLCRRPLDEDSREQDDFERTGTGQDGVEVQVRPAQPGGGDIDDDAGRAAPSVATGERTRCRMVGSRREGQTPAHGTSLQTQERRRRRKAWRCRRTRSAGHPTGPRC